MSVTEKLNSVLKIWAFIISHKRTLDVSSPRLYWKLHDYQGPRHHLSCPTILILYHLMAQDGCLNSSAKMFLVGSRQKRGDEGYHCSFLKRIIGSPTQHFHLDLISLNLVTWPYRAASEEGNVIPTVGHVPS